MIQREIIVKMDGEVSRARKRDRDRDRERDSERDRQTDRQRQRNRERETERERERKCARRYSIDTEISNLKNERLDKSCVPCGNLKFYNYV